MRAELMERYEKETGLKICNAFTGLVMSEKSTGVPRIEYTKWLESKLTWRDVSEKPKEGRVLIIENGRVLAVTYEIDDGDEYFLDDDGFECYPTKWMPIPKE